MYIVKRKNNIRLIYCINKKVNIENSSARYKVIVTVDCFRYCTNPYIN